MSFGRGRMVCERLRARDIASGRRGERWRWPLRARRELIVGLTRPPAKNRRRRIDRRKSRHHIRVSARLSPTWPSIDRTDEPARFSSDKHLSSNREWMTAWVHPPQPETALTDETDMTALPLRVETYAFARSQSRQTATSARERTRLCAPPSIPQSGRLSMLNIQEVHHDLSADLDRPLGSRLGWLGNRGRVRLEEWPS